MMTSALQGWLPRAAAMPAAPDLESHCASAHRVVALEPQRALPEQGSPAVCPEGCELDPNSTEGASGVLRHLLAALLLCVCVCSCWRAPLQRLLWCTHPGCVKLMTCCPAFYTALPGFHLLGSARVVLLTTCARYCSPSRAAPYAEALCDVWCTCAEGAAAAG